MRTCQQCGDTYTDRIDFCFNDGELLSTMDADKSDPILDPTLDAPLPQHLSKVIVDGFLPALSATPAPPPRRAPPTHPIEAPAPAQFLAKDEAAAGIATDDQPNGANGANETNEADETNKVSEANDAPNANGAAPSAEEANGGAQGDQPRPDGPPVETAQGDQERDLPPRMPVAPLPAQTAPPPTTPHQAPPHQAPPSLDGAAISHLLDGPNANANGSWVGTIGVVGVVSVPVVLGSIVLYLLMVQAS